jgi:ABC-type nitrate/sulfonate/bicarbonate transport system permease component
MKRIVVGLILSMVVACLVGSATARNRYANSPLKPWFDHLAERQRTLLLDGGW